MTTARATDNERRIDEILKQMTLEEKIDMIGGYNDFYIRANARLGIPLIRMADGPVGVRNYGDATAFPAQIGVTASWDTSLMHNVGAAAGREARAKGVHIMLAPAVNIHRAPMCGRNFEYLGEDPYLAGQMAAAWVKGVQSEGVVATVKHFAANNQEWDRHNVSSDMDERTLQEIYLPAFKAAVQQGGAGAVMTSYNLVNGVHASQNEHLIRDILKGQWKFKGIVMSDWTSTYDGVAAANAGLDLEMPSGDFMNRATLIPAVKSGAVKESVIDDKIRRMLRLMLTMGFFDHQQEVDSLPRYNPASRLVALQAAEEAIVLLKNKGDLLPLDRSALRSIMILGPNAEPAVTGGGGSSKVNPFRAVSVLDGMVQTAGDSIAVYYRSGLVEDYEPLFQNSVFTANGLQGLSGEYYASMNFEGSPAFTRTDRHIDFNWNTGPAEGFQKTRYSVRWSGVIRTGDAGVYDFIVRGDDGYRLYLDDELVINQWKDQSTTLEKAQRSLKANTDYRVRLEYYQNEGGAVISFGWGKAERPVDNRAITLAAKAGAAIVCVGFDATSEGEGSDRPFAMSSDQEALIKAVAKANPRTIVVLMAGGNVSMVNWIDDVPCLLHAWYPGQEGGTAIARIIFGDVNPSGKLPVSFEKRWEDNATYNSYYAPDGDTHVRYSEGVFLGYRHFDKGGIDPMFPFGFGLSYTTFRYGNLTLSSEKMHKGERLAVQFDITNTGSREGAEAAQLYIRQLHPSEVRPVKELRGFARLLLKPGETRQAECLIDESSLAFYSTAKNAWVTERGDFEVIVGSSSRESQLRKVFAFDESR